MCSLNLSLAAWYEFRRKKFETFSPSSSQLAVCCCCQDWVSLGHPSLPWLDDKRTSSLAQELTHCVRARDGSLVLRIGDRGLRPAGYFPVRNATCSIFGGVRFSTRCRLLSCLKLSRAKNRTIFPGRKCNMFFWSVSCFTGVVGASLFVILFGVTQQRLDCE